VSRIAGGRRGWLADRSGRRELVDGGGQVARPELARQPFIQRAKQHVLAQRHIPRVADLVGKRGEDLGHQVEGRLVDDRRVRDCL
jgi:hypothetical protein